MTLQFKIRGQTLYKLTPGDAVEGTRNYINCQFDFQTEDWEGCIKTALFQPPGGVEPYPVMLVDGTCTVPWEALEHPGLVSVSVFGVKDDYKITSSVVQIRNRATLTGGAATEPPTPTVYEQVLNDLAGTRQHATEQAQESKAAADEAKGYAESAANTVDGFAAIAETASESVANEGTSQVLNVQSAGQAAMQSVTAEGERQVETVGAAGTEALQAVQDAAAEIVADREQISTNKDNIASLQSKMRTKADAIVRTVSGESLLVQDSSDNGLRGLRVFGRTIQDGTPTPDAPVPLVSVGDVGSVELGVYGANLLDITKINSLNSQGITFTNVDNEYIKVVGTATGYASTSYFIDLPNGTYVLSGCNYSNNMLLRARLMKAGTRYDYGCGDPFEVTDEVTSIQIMIQADAGWVVDTVIRPMLTRGTTPLPYEPYNKQILTVSTPNGLPGIKVTNEDFATYTDADGQMWCSDEVDLERGVYVQRVKKIALKNCRFSLNTAWSEKNETLTIAYMTVPQLPLIGPAIPLSDHLQGITYCIPTSLTAAFCMIGKSNSTVLYVGIPKEYGTTTEEFRAYMSTVDWTAVIPLATPIETPLTSDILSMYSMLHSNYPVTTVLNDAGAGMEMQYNADTQLYIDNKIAEVLASIANTNAQLL